MQSDKRGILGVVLIIDLANNLLKHVFYRQQPRYTTVFIDDDRHMIVTVAEFFQ